ncbi:ABC transporter ATP-binding protein [Vagococcus penaei]|uniref:ABC transporter ATP-binding protein n=1 Tax=Vagococcus penaei TaxID=633807 RepID=A0A1Q2D452_9ENTE|nr:ABC transporter ATP-binding protein [Vagococcus penaei]AQP53170.1 ABC transporter ATP-binding protein [Vagococcus penaei]RSU00972.1 ABC transporter ATP-binding protein [Vagococcus penaei]
MKKIITAQDIIKTYAMTDKKNTVLDSISLDVFEGEFVSIMGPSGSGKSTLMYVLSGMDTFDSGAVEFLGTDLTGLSEQALADIRRQQMGFIFQQPTLLANLNLIDNIILPTMRDNRRQRNQLLKRAQELMNQVGIGELANRRLTEVSGGQLQRAGICRALMANPAIIFGDEPTGALNSKVADDILDVLTKINQAGTTVVLVTHDAKVAARSKRVLFMLDGQLVSELSLPEMLPMDERMERVLKQMQIIGI